jgi:uncharacterized protein (TIGR02588 family)
MRRSGQHDTNAKESAARNGPPLWERIVALFGALLIVSLLAYLLYEATFGDDSLPNIEVRVENVQRNGNDHVVAFAARNRGGKTAAEVLVRGELVRDGVVIETREAVLAYVPTHSVRRGGLFFRNDPATGELQIVAAGYVDP